MSSIIKLQLLLVKEGIQLYLDTTENESLVHRARNVAVGRFMQKTDCEYFLEGVNYETLGKVAGALH